MEKLERTYRDCLIAAMNELRTRGDIKSFGRFVEIVWK